MSTQAQRNKDAEILYPELKANFAKLSTQFVSQSKLDELGGLITEYGKSVGVVIKRVINNFTKTCKFV